jgi:hypothetical protein
LPKSILLPSTLTTSSLAVLKHFWPFKISNL